MFTHPIFLLLLLLFAALLSDTLRTYTKTGCDLEPLTLSCPRGTSISIDIAQYMPTSIENECIATTGSTAENIIQDGVVNAGTEIEIKAPEKCSWPNVLSVSIRYSFIIANIRRGLLPSIDQIALCRPVRVRLFNIGTISSRHPALLLCN